MSQFFDKIFDFSFVGGKPSLPLVVWAVYVGVMIAVLLALVSRVTSHRIVYALLSAKSDTRDSAKQSSELGFGKNPIYKYILRKSSPLRKYVKSCENGLYLPEEKRIGAELRFSREKHPIMTFVFAAVLFFAAGCLIIVFLPQIIDAYKSAWQ